MNRNRSLAAFLFLFAGIVAPCAHAQPIPPTFADVPYAPDSAAQKLDIYLPPGTGPFPTVVFIHGGGWSGGDKSAVGDVAAYASLGFATVSINYRLTGEAIFPAQIHDCKGAIRFLRANAAPFHLDPTRIGVRGTSAGGHLAALVGTSADVPVLEGNVGGNLAFSSRVQAAADFFGPTDIVVINLDVTTPPGSTLDHDAPTSPESHLVGWSGPGQGIGNIRINLSNPNPPYPTLVQHCLQINPITWVTADDPPFLIAHGTADTLVPLFQSTRLHNALTSAGLAHEYYEVPGAGHGNLGSAMNQTQATFFVAHLATPPPVPATSMVGLFSIASGLIVVGSILAKRRQSAAAH